MLVDIPGLEGSEWDIRPYAPEEVAVLVLLRMIDEDTYTPENYINVMTALVVQSQAIATRLRANRAALNETKR
jgi:hypothetical protein